MFSKIYVWKFPPSNNKVTFKQEDQTYGIYLITVLLWTTAVPEQLKQQNWTKTLFQQKLLNCSEQPDPSKCLHSDHLTNIK
jgi:hypothetical protein